MKLKDFISVVTPSPQSIIRENEREVLGLSIDSREVKDNFAFIAIKGSKIDGHDFIREAVNNGASTLVVERIPEDFELPDDLNILIYEDTQEVAGYLAANFYEHPSKDLTVIAVTGTKGKTTVTNMIKYVLEFFGHKCGAIGTIGIDFGNKHIDTLNTTPDSITLQKYMRQMADEGCEYCIMEASSQGFKRKRTNGIDFDIGVFLNIDQDHIGEGEHRSFEEYLQCKLQIFNKSRKIIVNSGDRIWSLLSSDQKERSITFSSKTDANYMAFEIAPYRKEAELGSTFKVKGLEDVKFRIGMPGEFNVQNAMAAIATLKEIGLNPIDLVKPIGLFQAEGRTQILKSSIKFNRTVMVDYAHNRLSSKRMLEALRLYNPRRLVCVFGLRWNETKMRRYDQGYCIGKYADLAILTEDNRGPETFEHIAQDVQKGLNESGGSYLVIKDRKEAIKRALQETNEEDIVVLCGMGNEHHQIINNCSVYFNEEEIVNETLQNMKGIP